MLINNYVGRFINIFCLLVGLQEMWWCLLTMKNARWSIFFFFQDDKTGQTEFLMSFWSIFLSQYVSQNLLYSLYFFQPQLLFLFRWRDRNCARYMNCLLHQMLWRFSTKIIKTILIHAGCCFVNFIAVDEDDIKNEVGSYDVLLTDDNSSLFNSSTVGTMFEYEYCE